MSKKKLTREERMSKLMNEHDSFVSTKYLKKGDF